MKKINLEKLADFIKSLMTSAENDETFDIAWFKETENEPFSIIGGWGEGFSEAYSDVLCISKSNPNFAMCVKIAVNEGPYAYTDYELMNMPINTKTEEVDDTCIALELDDDPMETAKFFAVEWERIMKEYGDPDDE